MTFSAREFRDALGAFATGVTIVTTRDEQSGEPIGMTASSFNSVSIDPPLILWSVTRGAHSADIFETARFFNVHILTSNQIHLSNKFAEAGGDKFAEVSYELDENGIAKIADVSVRLDCRQWAVYDGGDHSIIVGEVLNLQRSKADGLVFSNGSYATAHPVPTALEAQSPAQATGEPAAMGKSPIDDLLLYNLSRSYRQLSVPFHAAVRGSGLSVPEWRILASLRGKASYTLEKLAAQTFIEQWALTDTLGTMQDNGLCEVNESGPQSQWLVTGTETGHERVEDLFALGAKMEQEALAGAGDESVVELTRLLRHIMSHTKPVA